jgi:deoxyribodipyrimidine photo-lyase
MKTLTTIPEARIRPANHAPEHPEREYVLYWMIAARRAGFSYALQHAAEHARRLRRPLLVFEALRFDHRYASARSSRFVLDGMRDNARAFRGRVGYLPYLEPAPGAGRGLLAALASRACRIVTDDYPTYFLPRMIAAAARSVDVALDAVDGNGLLPMVSADRLHKTARGFRSFLQRSLVPGAPLADPLREVGEAALPELDRWRPTDLEVERTPCRSAPAPTPLKGGSEAGRARLRAFLAEALGRYHDDRNDPDREGGSHLSPYLHWGHLSAHEVVEAVLGQASATPSERAMGGARRGWWGADPGAEAFLDQLVTWRELGFNLCRFEPRPTEYDTLPAWARQTLDAHRLDPRQPAYDLETLRAAATHDPLWNAAQRQLLREGRIHNYMRMLWGKKILEWSPTPEDAWSALLELNDRFALDGRDPNSYTGIGWILGRYDRPWGPIRPIFGTVRYMSSANTARKLDVKAYLAHHA